MYNTSTNMTQTKTDNGESLSTTAQEIEDQLRNNIVNKISTTAIPWADLTGLGTILHLLRSLETEVFVAGGAVSSCIYGTLEQASDVDMWFRNLFDMKMTVAGLMRLGYACENPQEAVTLRDDPHALNYMNMIPVAIDKVPVNKKLQLIKRRWYPNCGEVIRHFDLLHCKIGISRNVDAFAQPMVVTTAAGAVEAAKSRVIYVSGSAYPESLVRRMQKYVDRGFTIPDSKGGPLPNVAATPPPSVIPAVYNKVDDPEYMADYVSMDPVDFNRKWHS